MMTDTRRPLRAWEAHLEEVIGVDDAAVITDAFDRHVSEPYLDHALAQQSAELPNRLDAQSAELTGQLEAQSAELTGQLEAQSAELTNRLDAQSAVLIGRVEAQSAVLTGQLTAAWRRDLLLVSVGQFFALAGAVAALVGLT